MSSIHTNKAALQALQAQQRATNDVADVQRRISTGLKVGGVKDNASVFAIAQGMRAEIGGWQAVRDGLDRGRAAIEVASSGAESISDLLNTLSERAVAYADPSDADDKAALRAEIAALTKQINRIATTSEFDGVALLTGKMQPRTSTLSSYSLSSTVAQPASLQTPMHALPPSATFSTGVQSSTTLPTSANFAAAMAQITGQNSQTVSVDAGSTAGRVELYLEAYGVPDVGEIWQNGVRVAATGQADATNGAPVAAGLALSGQHVLRFDYDPAKGQTLEFRFNENVSITGSAWRVGGINLQDPLDPLSAPTVSSLTSTSVGTEATFEPPLASADPEQAALQNGEAIIGGTSSYTLNAGSQVGRIDMVFDAYGTPDTVEVMQNGQRVAATGQAYAPGGAAVGAATAVSGVNMLSFDYDPALGDLTFNFNSGGADPDSAWVMGAVVLQNALAPPPAPQAATGGRLLPTYSAVNYDFLSAVDGQSTLRAASRDLTAYGLGLDPMDWEHPETLLAAIRAAQDTAVAAASYFGALDNSFATALAQSSKLTDTLEAGVGNLVDANIAKDAARLMAAQVKEKLSVETLAIANAAPQWMLKLFQD